jgi:hypothetical protein
MQETANGKLIAESNFLDLDLDLNLNLLPA